MKHHHPFAGAVLASLIVSGYGTALAQQDLRFVTPFASAQQLLEDGQKDKAVDEIRRVLADGVATKRAVGLRASDLSEASDLLVTCGELRLAYLSAEEAAGLLQAAENNTATYLTRQLVLQQLIRLSSDQTAGERWKKELNELKPPPLKNVDDRAAAPPRQDAPASKEKSQAIEAQSVAVKRSEAGKLVEADEAFLESLALAQRARDMTPAEVAQILHHLGRNRGRMARWKESEEYLAQAVEIRTKTLGADQPATANSLYHLAVARQRQNRPRDAEGPFRQSLATREAKLPADHPDIEQGLVGLADCLSDLARDDAAEPLYRRAMERVEK